MSTALLPPLAPLAASILATMDTGRFALVGDSLPEPWREPTVTELDRHLPAGPGSTALWRDTVVADDVETWLPTEVRDLAESVAAHRSATLQINAYLSHGLTLGFGPHWDDHDVLIVQLAGRKLWEVHQPAEFAPLRGYTGDDSVGPVAWSGVLQPGHIVYIPRGWAHTVDGFRDELSVHLTVSLRHRNGVELLGTLLDVGLDTITTDTHPDTPLDAAGQVPAGPDDAAILTGIATLRSRITREPWGRPVAWLRARQAGFAGHQLRLRLAAPLDLRTDGDRYELRANDTTVRLEPAAADTVRWAVGADWFTVDQLADVHPEAAERAALLDTLIHADLLALRPAPQL